MFKKFTNGCVTVVQKYLPDPFIFCIILTIFVFILGIPLTGQGPLDMAKNWGSGVWSLLAFSMQMALVLVLGSALASAPPVKKVIRKLASIPKTPVQAIITVTVISVIACWFNWGFGLVIGAIFAKEIARVVKKVDYRLLIASAYSGFLVWHGGISGSIPLTVAGENAFVDPVPTTMTIFSPFNLLIVVALFVILPFINAKMHPADDKVVSIDPKLLVDEDEVVYGKAKTPAEFLERSTVLSMITGALALAYIVYHFATKGFVLDLNIVNLIILMLGIILHGTPIRYVQAINAAVKGCGGILLQFPFYAGIMGMMTGVSAVTGLSLAGVFSTFFVSISNNVTFPLFTFLSAGLVNFFVPSGGGQWAVQAPIMMPAGLELNVSPAITAMAIAWGDAWTNMLQPFWALPALGIAGLGARDIMGFCVICLLVSGFVICTGFLLVGFFPMLLMF